MKKTQLFIILSLMSGSLSAAVKYDASVPQLEFAAQEVKNALKEAGREDLQVTLIVKPNEASPKIPISKRFEAASKTVASIEYEGVT